MTVNNQIWTSCTRTHTPASSSEHAFCIVIQLHFSGSSTNGSASIYCHSLAAELCAQLICQSNQYLVGLCQCRKRWWWLELNAFRNFYINSTFTNFSPPLATTVITAADLVPKPATIAFVHHCSFLWFRFGLRRILSHRGTYFVRMTRGSIRICRICRAVAL